MGSSCALVACDGGVGAAGCRGTLAEGAVSAKVSPLLVAPRSLT